jgi:hypothetical protein
MQSKASASTCEGRQPRPRLPARSSLVVVGFPRIAALGWTSALMSANARSRSEGDTRGRGCRPQGHIAACGQTPLNNRDDAARSSTIIPIGSAPSERLHVCTSARLLEGINKQLISDRLERLIVRGTGAGPGPRPCHPLSYRRCCRTLGFVDPRPPRPVPKDASKAAARFAAEVAARSPVRRRRAWPDRPPSIMTARVALRFDSRSPGGCRPPACGVSR